MLAEASRTALAQMTSSVAREAFTIKHSHLKFWFQRYYKYIQAKMIRRWDTGALSVQNRFGDRDRHGVPEGFEVPQAVTYGGKLESTRDYEMFPTDL